jgi:Big-like domain-containing protein
VLTSAALAGGVATYTTPSLSGKTHTIKAYYPGDGAFAVSTASVKQQVLKYSTTTSLSSTPNPSSFGQAVTFTATVTTSGPYAVTGRVKFYDGATAIGHAPLTGGVATLKKSTLSVGTHAITAQYLSDAYNDKSTSPVVNQVVQ